jgi:hypothetical protein
VKAVAIMTEQQFRSMFPKASKSFLAVNPATNSDKTISRPIQGAAKAKRERMNKTENMFRLLLKARFPDCEIRFEAYKLRIGERCYYCPDFAVIHLSGLIDFYECKGGHIWEDSLIKCKAAKEMYQHHIFEMWQCKKGSWTQIL